MILRTATRADLPAVLALLADEERAVDPASVVVDAAYERAFAAIESDPRNEMLVLADEDGTVLGCLQATYIPGLGRHGEERALIEAVRIRADRRGGGLGQELMKQAVDRARLRGCGLMQLTSGKRQAAYGRAPVLRVTGLRPQPRRVFNCCGFRLSKLGDSTYQTRG